MLVGGFQLYNIQKENSVEVIVNQDGESIDCECDVPHHVIDFRIIKCRVQIGVGIADITGPAADVGMMGYAKPEQKASGIHLRLYSRAFIIHHTATDKRVVFVTMDACMATTIVKIQVMKALRVLYGDRYSFDNVCITGTHTHSGPGGYHQYVLYSVTTLGLVKQSLASLVDGIVRSISRAENSIVPGAIFINSGELLESNINRSPTAYLKNPAGERSRFKYNVDKNMIIMKFTDAQMNPIGMISWFPVHCTSMQNTNKLISSDNKGYASILFEKDMNPGDLPGKGKFVAAFATSNEGDVSPNTNGAHCIDTGKPCQTSTSTCNGKSENCRGSGPGKNMFDSTRIIAENQYRKAKELFVKASERLAGPVDFIHQNVDMTRQVVYLSSTSQVKTCKPAMGFSFAAGTTDGPGTLSFRQGDVKGNLFWKMLGHLISNPSSQLKQCHSPKPILLATGQMSFPYPWQPDIVETQMLRIGQLAIVSLPGEFTTMAGRRLRDAVSRTLKENGFSSKTNVVLSGLSNTYTSYITTYEEYQTQRYEGASTIYGPHTLQAYIQQFSKLARSLSKKKSLAPGPPLPDLLNKQWSLLPCVVYDAHYLWKKFGYVLKDVKRSPYYQGTTVRVKFMSANPRNNLRHEGTFLAIHQLQPNNSWKLKYTDSHWETRFYWVRKALAYSEATVTWEIPPNQELGTYRISHYMNAKSFWSGRIKSYVGRSRSFKVIARK